MIESVTNLFRIACLRRRVGYPFVLLGV